ncbi:MAG TPA: hypothetical protein VGR62_12095 [Candidatus Binatia bacterium]|jgi:hypothetical protein|nr:hypothetical protein [Candidatus Binatia bacterium]
MRRGIALLGLLLAAGPAMAGYSRVYLVPALAECPGPATCPRAYESTYTFDSIVLSTASSKYMQANKPTLLVDFKGVRDASGAPLDGVVSVKVLSGRVSIPGFGTLPDGSPLAEQPPIAVTLTKGKGKLVYRAPSSPNGLLTNGGGVEIRDPDGKLLAVTGSQSKP